MYLDLCYTNHKRTHQTQNIRKPIRPGYLSIPDHSTTDHISERPVCHLDFCTVHFLNHPSLTTRTILSTPTKLTNLTTLTISTDQKNYEEDKCRIRIVYLHFFLPLLSQSPAWLPSSVSLRRGFETGHPLNAEDFGKIRRYKFRQKVVFWRL